jgi:heat-inducible transcriptional repressor
MPEVSDRALRILHAIVTEFIETGEPVGSRTIARKYHLDLSPASIRNVMADLEEAGFLYQPHTSAGRLPTEQAFRLFVDRLMTVTDLSGDEAAEIHALDALSPGMALLRESGRILSKLTGTASVVIGPRTDRRRLKELHFVTPSSSDKTLLAVLLFADGTVESRLVEVDRTPDDADLERMHNLLAEAANGKTLIEVREKLAQALRQERMVLDHLSRRAYELGLLAVEPEANDEPLVVIEGQSRLFTQPEFGDVALLQDLMRTFEDREKLVLLLDRTILARTVQVLMGEETAPLGKGTLSLIAAPYSVGDDTIGSIGVLGPTRMNYPRLVPLVAATATAVSTAHERAQEHGAPDRPMRRKPKRPA